MSVITHSTCDACGAEISVKRSARFQLTYYPSPLSTIPYSPSSEDFCSALCLLKRVSNACDSGEMLCGFVHNFGPG